MNGLERLIAEQLAELAEAVRKTREYWASRGDGENERGPPKGRASLVAA